MNILKLLCLSSTLIGSIIVISYSGVAMNRNWRIRTLFSTEKGTWLKIISFLLGINAIFFLFKTFGWWQAVLLIVLNWLAAFVLTFVFKSSSQYLSMLLILVGVILYFIAFSSVYYPTKNLSPH